MSIHAGLCIYVHICTLHTHTTLHIDTKYIYKMQIQILTNLPMQAILANMDINEKCRHYCTWVGVRGLQEMYLQ